MMNFGAGCLQSMYRTIMAESSKSNRCERAVETALEPTARSTHLYLVTEPYIRTHSLREASCICLFACLFVICLFVVVVCLFFVLPFVVCFGVLLLLLLGGLFLFCFVLFLFFFLFVCFFLFFLLLPLLFNNNENK